jgi:hypothetical protein
MKLRVGRKVFGGKHLDEVSDNTSRQYLYCAQIWLQAFDLITLNCHQNGELAQQKSDEKELKNQKIPSPLPIPDKKIVTKIHNRFLEGV